MTAAHDYARAAAAAVAYPDTRQLTVYRGGYQPSDYKPPAHAPDLRALFDRPAWMADAACRGMNPDLFFPERGNRTQAAEQACADCPVADQCLDYALERREGFGIWGGQAEQDRRLLRRQRGLVANRRGRSAPPAQCATEAGYAKHRSNKETPCEACREAHRVAAAARKAARKARAA